MDEEVLERDELDYLIQRLQHATYPSDEDLEEARWLRNYVGKTGFIQLGWPHQGIMFLYEVYHRVVRALSASARPGRGFRDAGHRRRPIRTTNTEPPQKTQMRRLPGSPVAARRDLPDE